MGSSRARSTDIARISSRWRCRWTAVPSAGGSFPKDAFVRVVPHLGPESQSIFDLLHVPRLSHGLLTLLLTVSLHAFPASGAPGDLVDDSSAGTAPQIPPKLVLLPSDSTSGVDLLARHTSHSSHRSHSSHSSHTSSGGGHRSHSSHSSHYSGGQYDTTTPGTDYAPAPQPPPPPPPSKIEYHSGTYRIKSTTGDSFVGLNDKGTPVTFYTSYATDVVEKDGGLATVFDLAPRQKVYVTYYVRDGMRLVSKIRIVTKPKEDD